MRHRTAPLRVGFASLALVLAAARLGRAAVPVIASAAPVQIYYDASIPGDVQFGYRIAATGVPTTFDATGLPPGATLNRSTGWINGSRNHPDIYDVAVRAANADGTATATVRLAIHPAATGVISSQGNFRAGQSFTFTVRYNAPVIVTGTPHLTLAIGSLPMLRQAVYVSGSGTTELVFRYAVAGNDVDPTGVRLLPSAPAGGVICDANGLTASPSLPLRHFVSGITIAATGN
jgi:hypothetical protein